jgi:NRPS condensation-like uncharacterized protein
MHQMRGPNPLTIPTRFPAATLDQVVYLSRHVADREIHFVITFNGNVNAEQLSNRSIR